MTDPLEGVDRAQLLADIAKLLAFVDAVADRDDDDEDDWWPNGTYAAGARLRRLVEPSASPAPAECGHQPEGVERAVSTLRFLTHTLAGAGNRPAVAIGEHPAAAALAKVRCHLPAGHHKRYVRPDDIPLAHPPSCCDRPADDPIHTARHDYGDPT